MIQTILHNLVLVSEFGGILALAWFSNFSASLYYNINISNQKFDKSKLLNGILKLLALCAGIASFTIVLSTLPIMLEYLNIPVTEELTQLFNITTIAGVFITKGIYPYSKQAFETFSKIISDVAEDLDIEEIETKTE